MKIKATTCKVGKTCLRLEYRSSSTRGRESFENRISIPYKDIEFLEFVHNKPFSHDHIEEVRPQPEIILHMASGREIEILMMNCKETNYGQGTVTQEFSPCGVAEVSPIFEDLSKAIDDQS